MYGRKVGFFPLEKVENCMLLTRDADRHLFWSGALELVLVFPGAAVFGLQ